MSGGWIGVDLDGTLAEYFGWTGGIGEPIPSMVSRVKQWLHEGKEVRVMTARVSYNGGYSEESKRVADTTFVNEQRALIEDWCQQHLGQKLSITCEKDFRLIELWDDRAVQVEENTGRIVDPKRSEDQYRLLQDFEIMFEGDQYLTIDATQWSSIPSVYIGRRFNKSLYYPVRRVM